MQTINIIENNKIFFQRIIVKIGERERARAERRKRGDRPKMRQGEFIGYCKQCGQWYNIAEQGQRYCKRHGTRFEDMHLNQSTILKFNPWLVE